MYDAPWARGIVGKQVSVEGMDQQTRNGRSASAAEVAAPQTKPFGSCCTRFSKDICIHPLVSLFDIVRLRSGGSLVSVQR